jgi:release factor glutamine methyltransferase
MSININEALKRASFQLRQNQIPNPRREAEALLTAAMGVTLAWLYGHGEETPSAQVLACFSHWVDRRSAGEPYAYLVGEKEFMGLAFRVTPEVLIPRPETEFLVEETVAALSAIKKPRILDVGTGSGAVAVTLAYLLPEANVTSVDVSVNALTIAAENAKRHGVAPRVRLLHGDLFAPVAGEAFDAVVSNPPYIPTDDISGLQREVRSHEPALALDGGPDGLDFYRRLTGELHKLGSPPQILVFEVGHNQADAVAALCQNAGYKSTRQTKDLAGIPRIILASRG